MVPRQWSVLALAAALLAGCGSGGGPAMGPYDRPQPNTSGEVTVTGTPAEPGEEHTEEAVPVPRRLHPHDDGGTFTMVLGQVAALIVAEPRAPDPTVTGDAVEVVQIDNITDSGMREWELRALRPGRTVLHSTDPAYTITLVVSDESAGADD